MTEDRNRPQRGLLYRMVVTQHPTDQRTGAVTGVLRTVRVADHRLWRLVPGGRYGLTPKAPLDPAPGGWLVMVAPDGTSVPGRAPRFAQTQMAAARQANDWARHHSFRLVFHPERSLTPLDDAAQTRGLEGAWPWPDDMPPQVRAMLRVTLEDAWKAFTGDRADAEAFWKYVQEGR